MHQINLNDEDVNFINSAASILLPMWRAQQLIANINTQVEQCKKAQAATAKEKLDSQIAEAVKAALEAKNDGVTGD